MCAAADICSDALGHIPDASYFFFARIRIEKELHRRRRGGVELRGHSEKEEGGGIAAPKREEDVVVSGSRRS